MKHRGARRWMSLMVVIALGGSVLAAESGSARLDALKALLKAGKYADAETGARALLAEAASASGADSVEAARVLDVLVESLWRGEKDYDPSWRVMAERAVTIKERALAPDDLELASSLNGLGALLHALQEYAAARAPFERALAIRERRLAPDHPDVALSLHNLAMVLASNSEFAAARQMYERAIATFERPPGPDSPPMVAALDGLAGVLKGMGDYSAARPVYERAIAIAERIYPVDDRRIANVLSNQANLFWFTGDYAESRRISERAHAIREKVYPPGDPDLAFDATQLAVVSYRLGDYGTARRLYEQALAIYEKAIGPDHYIVAIVVGSLGNVARDSGELDAARALFDRAVTIDEKALGPNSPQLALHLVELANLLTVTGDLAGARSRCERAVAIQEKAAGADNPALGDSLTLLANIRRDLGDVTEARALYKRSLAIREQSLGSNHPSVASTRVLFSRIEAMQGDVKAALEDALEGERVTRDHVRLTSRWITEREALKYAASLRAPGLAYALTFAADGIDGPARRRVLDALVRSRAVVLDEMAARHRALADSPDPEVASRARAVAQVRARLANLVLRGAGNLKATVFRKLIDDAQNEKELSERALAEKSESFARELSRGRIGIDEVSGSLPEGSALVAIVEYGRRDLSVPVPAASNPARSRPAQVDSYLAFVLKAGEQNPQVVTLGNADEMDSLVARWKTEVAGGTLLPRDPARAEAAYERVGIALRKRLWDPLAPALTGVTRVFVVPDGSLNLVNLAALPLDGGNFLIQHGPLVHYLSAERDLVPSSDMGHGKGLLALGGPTYDATSMFASLKKTSVAPPVLIASSTYRGQHSACGDFASVRFEPLPATGKETREIVHLWEKYGKDDPSLGGGALDLRDAAASETALKRAAPGRRVLHLATHGFFLGGACDSALASARGIGGLEATSVIKQDVKPLPASAENPLLLSGLVLAGANHRAAAAANEDDGILTAEEIASLDLSGVEWAVLSACETGVGDIRAGEGVFGLRRAFQVAGAGTLIMSLWSVDDQATRAWMKALYEGRLERHLDTAEAVHQASLETLNRRRRAHQSTHPFYWGAFVAAGDWR